MHLPTTSVVQSISANKQTQHNQQINKTNKHFKRTILRMYKRETMEQGVMPNSEFLYFFRRPGLTHQRNETDLLTIGMGSGNYHVCCRLEVSTQFKEDTVNLTLCQRCLEHFSCVDLNSNEVRKFSTDNSLW